MSLELYDIMATDHLLYAKLEKTGEITMIVVNEENNERVYKETSHEAAWDSLVYFAKQVISADENMQLLKESLEND